MAENLKTAVDSNGPTWQSKNNGKKKLIALLICLAAIVASMILVFVGSKAENQAVMIICLILAIVSIGSTIAVLIISQVTSLKWDISNLLFYTMEDGFYFTSVVNQDSYFQADWNEITGFSAVETGNDTATVTIYFDGIAYAGSFGKIKSLKMVKINEYSKLKEVFISQGIKETQADNKSK